MTEAPPKPSSGVGPPAATATATAPDTPAQQGATPPALSPPQPPQPQQMQHPPIIAPPHTYNPYTAYPFAPYTYMHPPHLMNGQMPALTQLPDGAPAAAASTAGAGGSTAVVADSLGTATTTTMIASMGPHGKRSPRHCCKCGSQECKGKGGRAFCTNPCQDCGKQECKGRNSRRPDKKCTEGWS